MFCHQCGDKLVDESTFCINCGAKVDQDNQITEQIQSPETPNTSIHSHETSPPQVETNGKKTLTTHSLFPYVIPLISLVLVSVFLIFTYLSEQRKNDQVLELQQTAEANALEGNFTEATKLLEDAIEIRPDYDVLQQNLDEVNRAQTFADQLDAALTLSANQQFDQAEQELTTLTNQLAAENSPLFTSFEVLITAEEETITIEKIKLELPTITNIDELANKLHTLEGLSNTEAEAVKTEIMDKIVQIAFEEASTLYTDGYFEEALAMLNKGLNYSSNNEQLLAFKDEIEQAITAFEEQAVQDDLHNRTAAVEVTYFDAVLEENGDITISGTLNSTATVPIYSLTVYLAIFDEEGNFLFEDVLFVEPYELNPGDEGIFEGVLEDVNQEAYIEITNITWYFDL
ncbi:zinc ribbon domain-containing protein [Ornithinibacillus sp. FSL M8-0202]|uniref:zinc ribbon domain-containing protein n=1 Tax=Ornithinibacillus sp. FSL M8-0202 TaxID=2921616 RepID=UPI0030D0E4A2